MTKRKRALVQEELDLINKWRQQAEEEKKQHPGEVQCWHCHEWHEDDPEVETCPHCGRSIWPF
jgi:Zn finger protein HypA/HybF involved in hydrogenase expression